MTYQITHLCRECSEVKPDAEFYRTAAGKPMHICKACHKRRMKVRRLTNPAVQAYDRMRDKRPERVAKKRAITDQWRRDHPEAYRAQTALNNALRDGKIEKLPCELCGSTENVHGHHTDYSRPLAVKWLCALCHHRIHASFPQLGGHYRAEAVE